MTAVPLPGVTWPVRHEVGGSLVLHPLWESQQHPHVIVGDLGAVGSAVRQTHTPKKFRHKAAPQADRVCSPASQTLHRSRQKDFEEQNLTIRSFIEQIEAT